MTSRSIALAFAIAGTAVVPFAVVRGAGAQATAPVVSLARSNAKILAPVYAMAAAMNRDDLQAMTALFAPDGVMVDEVAPFRWTGPKAVAAWSRDDGSLIARKGVTHSALALLRPTFVHASAERAYVVVPIVYTYTVNAEAQRETGLWTIVLAKRGAAWRFKLLAFAKESDTSDPTWIEGRHSE